MLARNPAVDSVRMEADTQRQAGQDTSVKASKDPAYWGQWSTHLYTGDQVGGKKRG